VHKSLGRAIECTQQTFRADAVKVMRLYSVSYLRAAQKKR
jgi:hypothetical protein